MLAFGTQVREFKPGRSSQTFQGEKIRSTPSFGREVKPFVPCHGFTACKRSMNDTWKSGIFRQNSSAISRPSSSSFHYYGLWWRHLAVQVRTTKDQGLYNKPSAAMHPGALAAGTLPQYNTNPGNNNEDFTGRSVYSLIIFRRFLFRMINVSDMPCRENHNTHSLCTIIFFFFCESSCRL